MPTDYPAKTELARRGVDTALLTTTDTTDTLLLVLARDYVRHLDEERHAHRALREMVELIPDAEDESPRDDEPAAWMTDTPPVAVSVPVQRFDRARATRRDAGRRLALLVEEWKRRHTPAAGTAED